MSAFEAFYRLRESQGNREETGERELINWIRALKTDSHFQMKSLSRGNIPYMGISSRRAADHTPRQLSKSQECAERKRICLLNFSIRCVKRGLPRVSHVLFAASEGVEPRVITSVDEFLQGCPGDPRQEGALFSICTTRYCSFFQGDRIADTRRVVELTEIVRALLEEWLKNPAEIADALGMDESTLNKIRLRSWSSIFLDRLKHQARRPTMAATGGIGTGGIHHLWGLGYHPRRDARGRAFPK